MGRRGASRVGLGLLIAGLPIALVLPLLAIMSWRLWTANPQPYWKRQLAYCFAGILLVATGMQLWAQDEKTPFTAGFGGVFAQALGLRVLDPLIERAGDPAAALIRIAAILLLVGIGLWLAYRALRLDKGWASRFKLPAVEGGRVAEPARVASDGAKDRKSTRLNSSHSCASRMPSSA